MALFSNIVKWRTRAGNRHGDRPIRAEVVVQREQNWLEFDWKKLPEGKIRLHVTIDDAGNLLEGGQRLDVERLRARIAETGGIIRVTPNSKAPVKIIEQTLQVLQRWARDRPLNMPPYVFRDGHLRIPVPKQIQASKLINLIDPLYPARAKEAGVEGSVELQITVNEEGQVSDAKVISGHELLRDAAVEAVKQWRYSPTLLNGGLIAVTTTVTVQFVLK